ncbi:hypothetical protein FB45DRAFT_124774 [Roridomyces roridus]|uniref:Uncharacterized protein n=1 Tax=Roridomyces roridus TaxID=1738132 RepID=A0AAD7FJG5_9AGAR|nr:hypothetical protein FB45DRAFT_124774 [Roridomyces roridus]
MATRRALSQKVLACLSFEPSFTTLLVPKSRAFTCIQSTHTTVGWHSRPSSSLSSFPATHTSKPRSFPSFSTSTFSTAPPGNHQIHGGYGQTSSVRCGCLRRSLCLVPTENEGVRTRPNLVSGTQLHMTFASSGGSQRHLSCPVRTRTRCPRLRNTQRVSTRSPRTEPVRYPESRASFPCRTTYVLLLFPSARISLLLPRPSPPRRSALAHKSAVRLLNTLWSWSAVSPRLAPTPAFRSHTLLEDRLRPFVGFSRPRWRDWFAEQSITRPHLNLA